MGGSEPINLIFWANALAGVGLIIYAGLLWLQSRGWFANAQRLVRLIRYGCMLLLLLPIAARYYYPGQLILCLSISLLLVAILIKLKRMLGV